MASEARQTVLTVLRTVPMSGDAFLKAMTRNTIQLHELRSNDRVCVACSNATRKTTREYLRVLRDPQEVQVLRAFAAQRLDICTSVVVGSPVLGAVCGGVFNWPEVAFGVVCGAVLGSVNSIFVLPTAAKYLALDTEVGNRLADIMLSHAEKIHE